MRTFVAGATGVIGVPLVKMLVQAGHAVAGMTRSPAKTDLLRQLGVEPVVCDVFDAEALREAVVAFAPDTVIHQLTDLPDERHHGGDYASRNNRIRREGTRNLLDAARHANVGRFVAQSVAWELSGDGGAAVAEHEKMVLEAGGVVVRYGMFYGPGTYHEADKPNPPRIQVEEAARRTLPALTARSGIIVITED